MDHESRLAVVENKIEYYENFMNKLELAIQKMSEASGHITKMLAVHEEKIEHSSEITQIILSKVNSNKEEILEKIDSIMSNYNDENREIKEKIKNIENNISDLQKMKSVVNGIGIATGVAITVLVGVFQWALTPQSSSSTMKTEHIQTSEK